MRTDTTAGMAGPRAGTPGRRLLHPGEGLCRSAMAWARLVVDHHCETGPGDVAVLACSQAELGRRLGHRSGSGAVSRRLGELRRAGIVLPGTPVRFDLRLLGVPLPSEAGPVSPGDAGDGIETIAELSRGFRLLVEQGHTGLADRTLAALLALTGQPERAEPARECSGRRADAARARASEDQEVLLRSDLLSSAPSRVFSARVAERGTGAENVRGAGRSAAAVLSMLEPLLAECRAHGLPGVTSMSGLRDALEPYDDSTIRAGALFLVSQMRSGAVLRSPVGVLVSSARRGELDQLRDTGRPCVGIPDHWYAADGRTAKVDPERPTRQTPVQVDPAHLPWQPNPSGGTGRDRWPESAEVAGESIDPLWDMLAVMAVDQPETVLGLAGCTPEVPAAVAIVQAYVALLRSHDGDIPAAVAALGRGELAAPAPTGRTVGF